MPLLHARDFRHLRDQMLRMLDEANQPGNDTLGLRRPGEDTWQPRCDVYVTDTQFHVVVDLAGVDRRSIRITAADDGVEIAGERKHPPDRRNAYYYTLEIETGRFSRHVPFFDEHVDSAHPDVQYEDGLLHITFNLRPSVERLIEVE